MLFFLVAKREMRVLESEKTLRESMPRLTASVIATFNANASATKAEETERHFEKVLPAGEDMLSRKCHPIPQFPEAESQAASEKTLHEGPATWEDWGTWELDTWRERSTFCGNVIFSCLSWAPAQAREFCRIFKTVSSILYSLSFNSSLFLLVQRV